MAKSSSQAPLLDPTHCSTLNGVLAECGRIQVIIDKCKEAGLTVDHYHEQNKAAAEVASGLKRQFFPDMP